MGPLEGNRGIFKKQMCGWLPSMLSLQNDWFLKSPFLVNDGHTLVPSFTANYFPPKSAKQWVDGQTEVLSQRRWPMGWFSLCLPFSQYGWASDSCLVGCREPDNNEESSTRGGIFAPPLPLHIQMRGWDRMAYLHFHGTLFVPPPNFLHLLQITTFMNDTFSFQAKHSIDWASFPDLPFFKNVTNTVCSSHSFSNTRVWIGFGNCVSNYETAVFCCMENITPLPI